MHHGHVLARAAVEGHAIDAAGEVDHHAIALLAGAIHGLRSSTRWRRMLSSMASTSASVTSAVGTLDLQPIPRASP